MNAKKRILALLMAAALTLTAFAGCTAPAEDKKESSNTNQGDNKDDADSFNMDGEFELNVPGEFPLVKGDKPAEFSIFTSIHVDQNAKFDAADNTMTAWLEDKLNVSIDWTTVTGADKVAKLNLLFQGKNYEDIIFGTFWNGATQYSYGEQGYIIPLNEYLDSDDAYWWNIYKDEVIALGTEFTEENLEELIMPDGNIYSLTQGGSTAYHSQFAQRMYIYQPWLDTLGLDTPTTTDEYYEVLKAFKTQDPNGNGKADEIPLTGSYTKGWNMNPMEFLMNSFVYYNRQTKRFIDVEGDGEIHLSYLEPEFKTGVEYLATLASEGLWHNEIFTQDNNQAKALTTQEVQVVGSIPGGSWNAFIPCASGTDGDWTNYSVLAPLKGPEGVQYAVYTEPKPKVKAHITNNCDIPKIAFRFLDSMYNTEISMNVVLGQANYEMLPEDTDVIAINGEKALYRNTAYGDSAEPNTAWSQIGNASGAMPGGHSYQGLQSEDPALDLEVKLYNAGKLYSDYAPPAGTNPPELIFDTKDAAQVVDYETTITTYFDEQIATMVTNNTVDQNWDAFIAGIENIGALKLKDLYNKAYQERLEAWAD